MRIPAPEKVPINMWFKNMTDNDIKYYTGFKKTEFLMVCNAININSSPYDHFADCNTQIVITLLKYRQGIDFMLIEKIYHLDRRVISNIFIYWTNAIYNYMKKIDFWSMRYLNPNKYTCIIDCTEIFTERSTTNPRINQELFSNYKNHNTFKYLVAIDEKGLIIFCSKIYGGSKSDRFIIEDSKIINLLEPGNIVLADRGFNVSDLLEEKGIVLNLPPFKTAPQFSPAEVIETRIVANRRIHVERVINLTKKYKILSTILPASLWPYANEIVYNANTLSNFKGRVIKNVY